MQLVERAFGVHIIRDQYGMIYLVLCREDDDPIAAVLLGSEAAKLISDKLALEALKAEVDVETALEDALATMPCMGTLQ